jgi:hypothetical protein
VYSLRQHGTLSFSQVIFAHAGQKITCEKLQTLGERKS